jgi:hypothetical protein
MHQHQLSLIAAISSWNRENIFGKPTLSVSTPVVCTSFLLFTLSFCTPANDCRFC